MSDCSLCITLLYLRATPLGLLEIARHVPEAAVHGVVSSGVDRHGVVLVLLLLHLRLHRQVLVHQRLRLHLLLSDGLHLLLHLLLCLRHSQERLLILEVDGRLGDVDPLPLVLLGHRLRALLEQVHRGSLTF